MTLINLPVPMQVGLVDSSQLWGDAQNHGGVWAADTVFHAPVRHTASLLSWL